MGFIHLYRFAFNALFGPCGCRFEPTCSIYALDAIRHYGCWKGCFLAAKRLLRCHPWHPGGCDPVRK